MVGSEDNHHFMMVAAATLKGGIGFKGQLPWRIPQDMKMFASITTAVKTSGKVNAVIMGRKTYESLPNAYKPLPHRWNVVISTTLAPSQPVTGSDVAPIDCSTPFIVASLDEAFALCWSSTHYSQHIEHTFVIGGAQVYTEALQLPQLAKIFLTRVIGEPTECDCFVPQLKALDDYGFEPVAVSPTFTHKTLAFDFVEYRRKLKESEIEERPDAGNENALTLAPFLSLLHPAKAARDSVRCIPSITLRSHEEFQYLDLIAEIIRDGFYQDDRTCVGTYVKLGAIMRFDLRRSFPLLTTKSVFWRGVIEELLWFIRSDTNANHLSDKGVKIWDANGSREFLDALGFTHREQGDLGPVYGFQWRHFGAPYFDMHTDYKGQGVDQLQQCISTLKTNPSSRRIIMSAWNPSALGDMALPPCHMFCQFFVTDENCLSCLMYQRSADMGLGVPFNIASYSLLCCMLAQVCDLERGEFIHVIGNAHVYTNHVDPLKEQLKRIPRPFPILVVDKNVKDIQAFELSHFQLVGYSPHPKITMPMAV